MPKSLKESKAPRPTRIWSTYSVTLKPADYESIRIEVGEEYEVSDESSKKEARELIEDSLSQRMIDETRCALDGVKLNPREAGPVAKRYGGG